ncbi:MAG: flagellar hook-basal body complex protein [Arcobacter sp.]|uniref:flagellar hook-basal body complex protein n=1 Tax=Arcobacter sp. TaxID=1872629 RepID=UPI00258AB6B1|nr:flagellar hook-basal body complex protein [Arcobacter sp.]MDD3008743.1 flagellar hook-basal body complex protein [Arcobacter sp.]
MIGALWTGISGLSAQQKALDNESNNIANVNTVGYKASRISFADQMYQDRIGKGSLVLDSEKLYTQGGTKLTGVNYDMALDGDGFFTVINKNTIGTAETFYTRAGNFRMGDNGTLQNAGGNEVQGWMMSPIDSQNDVTSTNPNTSVFTSDYTKLLSSKIIRHGTYVETITAKSTDYSLTAKSDSTSVFSGDGGKSKSAKVSDIEEAIKDYTSWLDKLKDEPDALSATSIAQTSQINFKSGSESIIGGDGHQIYAYINGNQYAQNFIVTSSTQEFRQDLWDSLSAADRTAEGLTDPSTLVPAPSPTTPAYESAIAAYDKAAGKIATYKALADSISQKIPGLVATMAIDSGRADAFNTSENYAESTNIGDMLKGIIQIKSLIPGKEFRISEVGEVASEVKIQGNYQTTTNAQKGSGVAGLETSKDALAKLITGKQQDVYTPTDLKIDGIPKNFTYGITVYDKELGVNIPVPNDGGNPPQSNDIFISNVTSIDDAVTQINANSEMSKYIEARNVNGNLVVQTLDSNYDVEFNSRVKQFPSIGLSLNNIVDNATYNFNININGNSTNFIYTPAVGVNTTSASEIYNNLKSQINTYNSTAPEKDKIEISSLKDGNFSIYSNNEGTSFNNSSILINGESIPAIPTATPNAATPTVLADGTFTINPADYTIYTIDVLGKTISYTSGVGATASSIYNGLVDRINNEVDISNLVNIGALGGNNFTITQTSLNTVSPNVTINAVANISYSGTSSSPGTAMEYRFAPTLADNNSSSVVTLNIEGVDLKIKTDQTPTVQEIATSLAAELAKNEELSEKVSIEFNAGNVVIKEKIGEQGYQGILAPSMVFSSLTDTGDEFKTIEYSTNNTTPIDKNANYSGRKGAGAEFIEIVNKVDQTASKGSLQLRLDTLGISDSAFGEFSVDSTGLITMKQDGADFAIGQIAIAVFNNNRGLNPVGNNLLAKTNESGDPVYNLNNNKTAQVMGKTLELSTADLSESLVNLMVFQRAFEANAKSITTSDDLLNTLINLKR